MKAVNREAGRQTCDLQASHGEENASHFSRLFFVGLESTKKRYPYGYLFFKSARRRTRSGGPRLCADRSGAEKIESSSPGLDSKKAAIPFGITAFSRARDGDRTRDPLLGKEVLHR